MKDKNIFNLKNIKSFIEGNINYYKDEFSLYPDHKKEQVYWRLSLCKEDCLKDNECVYCGCPPLKKAYVEESCNDSKRFPDMMNKEDWEQYKKEKDIKIWS